VVETSLPVRGSSSGLDVDLTLVLGDRFSLPSWGFQQDPADYLALDPSQDAGAVGLDSMDWTSWNEFVSDAYADGSDHPGGSDNPGSSFPFI